MSNIIKSNASKLLKQSDRLLVLKNFDTKSEKDKLSNDDQELIDNYSAKILEEAQNTANQIIEEAQRKYKEMQQVILAEKESLETEKQLIIKDATEKGFQVGYDDGRKIGSSSYHEMIEKAKEIVEIARKESIKHVESSEEIILSLGMKVAEKIIGEQITTEPQTFLSIVKNAIKEVKDHSQIQISVHPSSYELLVDSKDDLKTLINSNSDIFIFPDPDLDELGCIVESSYGKIEASVDSQLEEIKLKLLSLLMEE